MTAPFASDFLWVLDVDSAHQLPVSSTCSMTAFRTHTIFGDDLTQPLLLTLGVLYLVMLHLCCHLCFQFASIIVTLLSDSSSIIICILSMLLHDWEFHFNTVVKVIILVNGDNDDPHYDVWQRRWRRWRCAVQWNSVIFRHPVNKDRWRIQEWKAWAGSHFLPDPFNPLFFTTF